MPTNNFIFSNTLTGWMKHLGIAVLYLLFGYIMHASFTKNGIVSVIWPGSGLALAALLIGGRRYIWGVLLGALLVNALVNDSLVGVIGTTLASILEVLLGAWLLTRNDRSAASLSTLEDYLRLIVLGGGVASIAGAVTGALALLLEGFITPAQYFENVLHWWMGDTLGVVLLTPLILAWWWTGFSKITAKQLFERLLLTGFTFIAGQIVFLNWFHDYFSDTPKGYWMFFCISWVAIRMGTRGSTFIVSMIAIQALLGAYQGVGFFAHDIAKAGLFNYWAYMLILSVIGLSLSTYVNEIEQGLDALKLKDSALNAAANGIVITDVKGRIKWANPAFSRSTGFTLREAFGLNPRELVKSGKQDNAFYQSLWETILANKVWHGELVNRRKDGSLYDEEMTITPITDEMGRVTNFVAVKQDITERKHAENIQEKLTRALTLLSKCNALLVYAENEQGILSDICKLAVETGGYMMAWVGFAENNVAKTVRSVAQSGYEEGYLDSVNIVWSDTEQGQGPTGTAIRMGETVINQNILTDPKMALWREAAIRRGYQSSIALPLISNKRVFGALNIYSDESDAFVKEEIVLLEELANDLAYGIQTLRTRAEHEAAKKKLEFLAHHDPLTGLPNRLLLRDRFAQAAALANRERSGVAVLFLDLDNFKHVNDSLGHTIGDQLLIRAVERIHICIRDTDTISRQGGDEFIILLTNIHDLATIDAVAQKIIDAFVEPFYIDNHTLTISFSIGISLFPDDGSDFDTLLKQADTALYQAKDAGRNTYRFFSEQMNIDAMENMRLQSQLHNAIKNQELRLHYQPQIDIVNGRIIGAEALVRWQHPELGLVSPAKFIPLAERSGLIIPIGEWVLNEACRQAHVWRETNRLPPMIIAVNLSSLQFKRGNIVETVTNALVQSGLPASQLELELTESILLDDLDVVKETLHQLKEIGVKLSIDDFGTGYSSLSYLKKLAVDKLKIDQSFVRDMVEDSDDAAIVKAIIQLGHTLQLTVIAEGVENDAQLAILKNHGCDEVQGYLFSRPIPAKEFAYLCNQ